MEYLHAWTIFIIFSQACIAVAVCWLTLDCQLSPRHGEYSELTLMKMLYFYDPEACDRVIFYNVSRVEGRIGQSSVVWPKKNAVAAKYRRLVQYSVTFHVIWLFLAILNVTLLQKSYGFYCALLPCSGAGAALLVSDLVYTGMFLGDLQYTKTEEAILSYIGAITTNASATLSPAPRGSPPQPGVTDTSWASLLMAYCCCRGVALWVINFWVVKDNYVYGLACHRRIQAEKAALHRNRNAAGLS